ncbi:hypothetical protein MKW98_021645 [Papaver atlanticum]|uniref:Uncharacterized protein n=1 Tax=Papaver atlanticum TaxID=357466 RepID=A0AAD4X7G4_9MAGN|nr:hypothetical protein MKW98_007855 [Papaver atlanticum]KAI3865730.1 hypothetical protein MKW98_021645 [Papaver atlanticum]
MNDRRDYKSAWQMEREWEEAEKNRKRNLALKADDEDGVENGRANLSDDDEDALSFECFMDPMVNECRHYFFEHCALKVLTF